MPVAITPPQTHVALKDSVLFAPLKLGHLSLKHRIIQVRSYRPPTRACDVMPSPPGVHVPGPRVVKYYGDRATDGGLQITEATDICLRASGYGGVPGVFTESQLKGWRKVTDAVHAKGGFIFTQLWHTGRASSSGMRGERPISSGEIPMNGKYLDGTECKDDPHGA
ncbi:hypothetical protein MRS44_015374 [Fusarium solani]|uniref:uncharacterized protein n=1 Tax=Fusarium solani TaxID=169388 RepID=UPI0032C46FE2|nr:hypothetical protein MRS44_015374 [Fusarium solani]